MQNVRKYGKSPFSVAVIHGGPGAPGEMAPVARKLSSMRGILEPLQTASSLKGQVQELKSVLQENADLPVVLIGFSWGAWLSYIFTALYPYMVSKVVLISSGPFEEKYAEKIMQTRLGRMGKEKRSETLELIKLLDAPGTRDKDRVLTALGKLIAEADSYDPLPVKDDEEAIKAQFDIHQGVWEEAAELRRNGKLLALGKEIRCPVTAIHGDYDPHPAEGIASPLSSIIGNFKFILLERCGHKPWMEKSAVKEFYLILQKEITS